MVDCRTINRGVDGVYAGEVKGPTQRVNVLTVVD